MPYSLLLSPDISPLLLVRNLVWKLLRKMALVNVTNVIVLNNPTAFTNDFQFEVCMI